MSVTSVFVIEKFSGVEIFNSVPFHQKRLENVAREHINKTLRARNLMATLTVTTKALSASLET